MPYVVPTTFTAGSVLTAAQMNVIGADVIDHELYVSPLRSAWTSYTPTLAQGASTNISKTLAVSKYLLVGKSLWIAMRAIATGTGTAGSAITISLPAGMTTTHWDYIVGAGQFGRSGTGSWNAVAYMQTASTIALVQATDTTGSRIGVAPNIAMAVNDQIVFTACLEIS